MNNLDKQYQALLQDILDNGVQKSDRTGTGTISVFGRQIRHKMSEGFPLLTTKKMPFKTITTELLWFLRGDTNIKYLVDNNCHIWDGDAYKRYLIEDAKILPNMSKEKMLEFGFGLTKEEFINKIKTDDEFAKKCGDLGPIYGKQWRSWETITKKWWNDPEYQGYGADTRSGWEYEENQIDQIANLINDLKTNPDSRRLLVTAWNPTYLPHQILPPCHYGFQVYTRELTGEEEYKNYPELLKVYNDKVKAIKNQEYAIAANYRAIEKELLSRLPELPTRAISLMWTQRSVDTFLGLPFNIASYGLLLEIIAKAVNMVPDELIGNLGDVHLYSNHIKQAKKQIGRELTFEERVDWWFHNMKPNRDVVDEFDQMTQFQKAKHLEGSKVPYSTREPYSLPKLNINTEWWPYESGECGEGQLNAIAIFESFKDENFCKCLLEEDIQLSNYQSHPAIKAPLSN